MRTICALMLLVASAAAQDAGKLDFTFQEWSGANSVNITTMATVSDGGEVKIDWALVEKVAADNNRLDHATNMARLMLAIRDKTYKELR